MTGEQKTIAFVCIWELVAFASNGRLPTWTGMVIRLPRPIRKMVLGLVGVWMVAHFQLVERET